MEETDKLLEKYNFLWLNQEEIENVNNSVKSSETKTVLKVFQLTKVEYHHGFTGKICQTFREKLTSLLLNLFQKFSGGGTQPNSFYEAIITLIPIPDKDITQKRKLQVNITGESTCKNHQQNSAHWIQQYIRRMV